MTTKEDTIEEISDMLDSLSTAESLRIFRKLNTGDLLTLSIAIRKYGDEREQTTKELLQGDHEL